jgi:hypothetical protein
MDIFIHNIKNIEVEINTLSNDTAVKIIRLFTDNGNYDITLFADTFKQLEFNNREEKKQC